MTIFRYNFLLFTLSFIMVVCDEESDKNDHPASSENYLSIFKNMPVLYEYIIDTLTKKPEVLELSQSYYTDTNIYEYYKRYDDEEDSTDDSERMERSEKEGDDDDKSKTDIKDHSYLEYNIASNAKTVEQDYDNIVNKRDDNNENESKIDPQEIIEKALWVEDQLQKYNDSR